MSQEVPSLPPSVSAIMPLYTVPPHGAQQGLELTISSLLAQSFTSWQMLLVDDGSSSDALLQIAQQFARRDERITVLVPKQSLRQSILKQQAAGQRASCPRYNWLERACGQARGKYIAFLHSGDLLLPDFFAKLYNHTQLFVKVDIALIGCQLYDKAKAKSRTDYADAWAWWQLTNTKLGRKRERSHIRCVCLYDTCSYIRFRAVDVPPPRTFQDGLHNDPTGHPIDHSAAQAVNQIEDRAWSRTLAFYLLCGLSPLPWRKLYRRDFLLQHAIRLPQMEPCEPSFEGIFLHWQCCLWARNILFCDTLGYQHNTSLPKKLAPPTPFPNAQSAEPPIDGQLDGHLEDLSDSQAAAGCELPSPFAAELAQWEQVLDYLLHTLEPPRKPNTYPNTQPYPNTLGQGEGFYLLLWLRCVLQSFCYSLRPQNLKQWQARYLALEAILRKRVWGSPLLAKTLKPLHKVKFSDCFHLRLGCMETIAWQILTHRITREQSQQCSKPILAYLAILHFPLTNYWRSFRQQLRYYLVDKLR